MSAFFFEGIKPNQGFKSWMFAKAELNIGWWILQMVGTWNTQITRDVSLKCISYPESALPSFFLCDDPHVKPWKL